LELRATQILATPELRLLAIESMAIDGYRCGICLGISATLAPRAVIVIGRHGVDALDTETGEAITLERLRRELPGLDEILAV
jgi:hypothetical protein